MALTPEDVVKKEFSKPKGFGRSGYDENQVDDFLDEIVVELRRLTAQNDDLSDQLEDCRRGKGTATSGAAVPGLTPVTTSAQPSADVAAKDEEIARLKRELEQARSASTQTAPVVENTEKVAAVTAERDAAQRELADAKARIADLEKAQTRTTSTDQEAREAAEAANVIALAQRVHDEHVLKGQMERDRLISEATAHHDKVISEADAESNRLVTTAKSKHDELIASGQQQHDELVAKGTVQSTKLINDAEEKRRSVLADLVTERQSLDAEVEKLKKFEAEYRSNLKGYLSEQLRFLDRKSVEPAKTTGTLK